MISDNCSSLDKSLSYCFFVFIVVESDLDSSISLANTFEGIKFYLACDNVFGTRDLLQFLLVHVGGEVLEMNVNDVSCVVTVVIKIVGVVSL
jgi:hypothetical protein